jgi:hypothetical protein
MNQTEIKIRKAVEADSEKLWILMKELAVFEKYIDVCDYSGNSKRKRIQKKPA